MILAFSHTTAAFVARRKTVTRRDWSDKTFEQWLARVGTVQDAWSKSPRFHGQPIGKFLVKSVSRELTREIPESDWEAEGFAYMVEHGIAVDRELTCHQLWRCWRVHPDLERAVIRFEVTEILPGITEQMFWPEEQAA